LSATAPAGTALAVLDTNAWLDLYVFADPGAAALAQAIAAGRLRPLRCARTDAELRVVLQRPAFSARCDAAAAARLLEQWAGAALPCADPPPASPWRCRDPDDQKFLDLARAGGAAWLFTKDRALLDLARKARTGGLRIAPPATYVETDLPSPAQRERGGG
jgi:predicted nucleic acid-binding protein